MYLNTLPAPEVGRKEHALALAAAGFYVLPVKAGEKRPDPLLAPGGFTDATRDAEAISGWFDVKPKANIGIACGAPYGLLVVDVDVKNGAPGMTSLGKLWGGDATLMARTPSGGLHLYFQHPGEALRAAAAEFPGIDFKGADGGGYVLAPPSTLPNGAYSFRDVEVPVVALPADMLARLRKPAKAAPAEATGPAAVLRVPEGQRHARLVELGAVYRAKGLTPDEVETLLWEHARRYFDPPFSQDNPQDAREIEAVVHWFGGKAAPATESQPLEVLTCAELLARAADKPAANLLEPILPEAGNLMIHGAAGVGKSYLALAIMLAAAQGGTVLGWRAARPSVCLYIDGEMPLAELAERLRGYLPGTPPANLHWLAARATDGDLPDLASLEAQARYLEVIERTGAELVTFDNLTCLRATTAERPENSVEAWYPVASFLRQLNGRGVATILVHHSAKSGTQRGSSAHVAVMDTVIGMRAPGEGQADPLAANDVELVFEKHRRFWGDEAQPLRARCMEDEHGAFTWERAGGDPLAEDAARLRRGGHSVRDIATKLGRSKRGVEKALERAKVAGLIPLTEYIA